MSNPHNAEIIFHVDLAVYRLTALKKTAYRFSDRCAIQLRRIESSVAEVTLKCLDTAEDVDKTTDAFWIDLLDQELREQLADETQGIRSLLLAQAFSSVSLTDPESETLNYDSDPLEFGRPDSA